MPYVLLLEDVDSDAHEVESALKQIGGYEVQRFIAASRAIETLSDALSSGSDLPDLTRKRESSTFIVTASSVGNGALNCAAGRESLNRRFLNSPFDGDEVERQ